MGEFQILDEYQKEVMDNLESFDYWPLVVFLQKEYHVADFVANSIFVGLYEKKVSPAHCALVIYGSLHEAVTKFQSESITH